MKKALYLLAIAFFSCIGFVSCQKDEVQNEVQKQELSEKNYDVFVSTIKKITESDNSLYNIAKLSNFDFSNRKVVVGNLYKNTRSYAEDDECIYFDSKNADNEVVAFYVNKISGVEKSAIFEYNMVDNVLYVSVYDLDKNKLLDAEVDAETQTGVITEVYTEDIQSRGLTPCNAAIYAAGTPWTVGFGMVNPLAGLAAGTFFWLLENAIC